MADHRDRVSALCSVILVRKRAPDHGFDAQHGKVRSRHKLDVHGLRIVAPFNRSVRPICHAESRGYVRENLILLLHLAIEMIGVEPRIRKPIANPLVESIAEQNQPGRILHRQ